MEGKLYLDREESRCFSSSFMGWNYWEEVDDLKYDMRDAERDRIKEAYRSCRYERYRES